MPCRFSVNELKGKDMRFEIGSVQGSAVFLNHPGVCVGYRLQTPGGVISYLTDHEPFERYKVQTGKTSEEDLAWARREDMKIATFVADSDILIVDSQYTADEYACYAGWGHACVDDVVALGVRAKAKRLFLFHHDPDHDDAKIDHMVAHARELAREEGSGMLVEAAREKTTWCLPG